MTLDNAPSTETKDWPEKLTFRELFSAKYRRTFVWFVATAVTALIVAGNLVYFLSSHVIKLKREEDAAQADANEARAATVKEQDELARVRADLAKSQADLAATEKTKAAVESELASLQAWGAAVSEHASQLARLSAPREQIAQRIRTELTGRSAGERADMLSRRGFERLDAREFGNAEFFFQQALAEQDTWPPALLGMGEVMAYEGNFQQAVGWYDKAIAAKPRYKEAFLMRAWLYCNVGKYDEAERSANLALDVDGSYGKAMEVFAAIKQKAPNRVGATPHFQPKPAP